MEQQAKIVTALVVEDNALFRTLLVNALGARFPRARLLEADCVKEGLEQARRYTPELVIMDVSLPDGNGLDLTRVICRETPRTHVIVCTSHSFPEYRCAAEECGAAHFMVKASLDLTEFLEAAAAALESEHSV